MRLPSSTFRRLPQAIPYKYDKIAIANALRLEPREIGFENHVPSIWDAGVPFLLVPIHGLEAAGRISINQTAMKDVAPTIGHRQLPVYAYCRETILHGSHFHSRMFVSDDGTYEDPATGSATAAFAGAIHAFDEPLDGVLRLSIEQGHEMGRPSRLRLELDIVDQKLTGGRIGGSAIRIAEGQAVCVRPNFALLLCRRHKVFKKGWTGRICPVIEPSLSVVKAADGHIAQLVEQLTLNQRVVGSIPTVPTILSKKGPHGPFFMHARQAPACSQIARGEFP